MRRLPRGFYEKFGNVSAARRVDDDDIGKVGEKKKRDYGDMICIACPETTANGVFNLSPGR